MMRKRNHSLFISFTVANKQDIFSRMCIARMCREFITQKNFQKELTKVANHYGARMIDILALDGVTDDPARYTKEELEWANVRYYKEQDEETFPRFMKAFDDRDLKFLPDFALWDWDYDQNTLVLIRESVKRDEIQKG